MLLTAVSPWYDISLDGDHLSGIERSRYSSIRNSDRGYWNEFVPLMDHSSLSAFTESVENYVKKGMLFSASELYLPIRLKPRGVNTISALAQGGVDHIELRMFDLNPFTEFGVDENDLTFAHLLILWLLTLEDTEYTHAEQKAAVRDHRNAALYDLSGVTVDGTPIIEKGREILDDMKDHFSDEPKALAVIAYELDKLENKRLCERLAAKDIYSLE